MAVNIDPNNWREDIKQDSNFSQEVPYNFKQISAKLKIASQDVEHLNPYSTLSAIYDFTKIFYSISSALSKGFSDITSKVNIMRGRFAEFPDAKDIQDLLTQEINLGNDIYKCNGNNNASFNHENDKYSHYCSACRTFLRLMWFMEYLISVFTKAKGDNGSGSIKSYLSAGYNDVLAPRHSFLVRSGVRIALSFPGGGTTAEASKLIFELDTFDDNSKNKIQETIDLMKKIWQAAHDFYEKNNLLDLS